ncbi:MAG: pilus assembly protein N-terminal domain-containing protein [Candidatus Omnitrophica bacterium]|nr:pilus assembly protein N-terminal domain-containing protein [Candidatus Omnitrophota bacterium]MBU1810660.1 pilus assembly protein N-terminal domain-containing protein [Candidatus Omnitrophota bacterium]
MDKKLIFIFIAFLLIFPAVNLYAQYYLSYDFVMELADKALEQGDYKEAIHYLNIAQILRPDSDDPLFYINFIKRLKEGRVEELPPTGKRPPHIETEKEEEKLPPYYRKKREDYLTLEEEKEKLPFYEYDDEDYKDTEEIKEKERKEKIKDSLTFLEKALGRKPKEVKEEMKKKVEKEKATKEAELVSKPVYKPGIKIVSRKSRTLYLTDELFATQPKTQVEINLGEDLIVEGKSIKRYFTINPRVIDVTRIDDKKVKIITKNIGETFLHLWEENRRWTFNIKVVPAFIALIKEEKKEVYQAEPFKLLYNANLGTYYSGRRLKDLEKETISFSQWAGFIGDTPYGELDGSGRWVEHGNKIELTSYTLGLTDGRIFNFKDFNIRGFDISKGFSDLSYPGQLLKGIWFDADAFGKKINYALVWGKEKEGVYGYVSPGILEKRDSCIEGARIKLFPYSKTNYTFNYARGFGGGRESYLKDKVYSFEFEHSQNLAKFYSELAYDEDSLAGFFNSSYKLDDLTLRCNLRNIEKNFTTISGYPPNRGEIGGVLGLDLKISDNVNFSSDLDIYRDRYLFNEEKKRRPNFNSNTNLSLSLSPTSSLYNTLYYTYEPGLSFPRRYLNARTTYSKSFKIFNERSLSTFLGAGYQRSRNFFSRSSDYNVYTLSSGLRLALAKDLSYYLNYNYNFLEEQFSGQRSRPAVLETGVDYYKKITPNISSDLRFYFRDEENTTSTHSFLAGEDSIEGSLRLTYAPFKDVELFAETRVRNIWAESAATEEYMEAEVRFGINSSWDTFFRWNPRGRICGFVFKDLNGDGKQDMDDPPLEGIKIIAGKKELITDAQGYFSTNIRAKKVTVRVESDSLPQGYVFTTPSVSEVDIYHGKENKINFGATTSSTIYGIVFYDANGNKKFDAGDIAVGGAKLALGEKTTFASPQGRYFFRGLEEGKYTITLDINTLPIDYLPTVPIKKEVEIYEGINYIYHIPLRKK